MCIYHNIVFILFNYQRQHHSVNYQNCIKENCNDEPVDSVLENSSDDPCLWVQRNCLILISIGINGGESASPFFSPSQHKALKRPGSDRADFRFLMPLHVLYLFTFDINPCLCRQKMSTVFLFCKIFRIKIFAKARLSPTEFAPEWKKNWKYLDVCITLTSPA